jgi:spectinomycin phosphotransferase
VKSEPPALKRFPLANLICRSYGFEPSSIHHLPKGEDASGYSVADGQGEKYFVRIQALETAGGLERAYEAVSLINRKCSLPQIVQPLPTLEGTFACRHSDYVMAIFPFVEGATAWERGFTATELTKAAAFLARLHDCDAAGLGEQPQERFRVPFKAAIQQMLDAACDSEKKFANPQSAALGALLLSERSDILTTIERIESLGERLAALELRDVVTHGDPNLDNWLVDRQHNLHLVDWGEVALGPRERDMFAFCSENFRAFWEGYRHAGGARSVRLDVMAFYFYRWTFQEIACYGPELLFRHPSPSEARHASEKLSDYLPIRHDAIARELARLRDTVPVEGSIAGLT